MDRLPSFMRTGSSNQLSALKMRIEPKFTSVPDRLRRPSDINRVPQMLSFLNNRTGYGSDDEDGNEDSDSSDGQVEGSERPAVSTLHTVASRHAEDPDGNAAQTAIDCVQEPSVAQPMSPVPSPVIPHTQSIAEAYDPTIELDALRSGGAAQYSQGEAQHEDEGEQTCGPHGINVNPSTWQPISHSPVEGDVTIVVRPNTEVPLFEQVVAQSVSPEKPVASSPPTEDAALHSDEELERTITDVSSAVFDATRPLPISEVQHDHQYEERLLATGTPSDYNGNDNSSDLSSVQRLKQAALPPRYVSPIVSIPRTSPLEDVEDMVDVEDFATDAGGDEDMMHLDRSAADEIDEGAGNEHEIEISGSSMDRDEVMDGAEDDGETDDIAHASKADGTLQTNDPGDLNSSVDACDMLSTEDLDGADPMQTIEEEMLVGALPDRSQEASQQLLNDAMNAMLAEQPSPGKSARYARSHSLPGNDVMIDDVVVPGSKSSALAGSDTFVVIQHFDRRIESPTVREKRKMTGITSKHFTPVKSARKKRAGKAIDPHDILDADANADDDLTAHSSASLYDTPGSATTYPTRSRRKAQSNASKASTYATAPETPVQPADEVTSVPRTSSTTRKRRVPAGTSASPVPPITEKYFGLIQDKLWTEPFWLLVAVIFLNLTTGRTAAPVFWALKEDYPTPEALAAIDASELFNRIERLGLANNRTKTILGLAKTWVEFPPVKGVRYRKLHYPNRYDGKEYKPADVIESDSELIEGLIEIAHLPGCGHYALDSWRIFCRDVLRCVATDFNGEGAEDANFEPEWMRVLPLDKELRACLRWMWMREGFVWDVKTGKKRPATAEELEKARKGEMAIDDVGEKKFAVAAAADAASGGNVDAAEVARPGSGDEAVQNAAEEGGKKTKRKSRTKKVRKSLQRQESAELQASAAESVVKRRSRRSRSSE
ncbi:hypothetical protein B0A48_05754 [Cryoendolithus antarcticus]|uniref:HhH-GPD domain-containing protein n=1 Tax=Cryoendolithus antarcticus TaxID=1507870 RepID=A0A1V8TC54_9PEZI|nr:hypothetical protein B0A48_05754 [Cryoendolithus antarcticus]